VGIDCNSIIGSLGALHCITKEVGVEDPLLIVHQALRDTVDYLDAFEVNATIKHRSGIQSATLYYTTDTLAGYQSTPMTLTDADNAVWTGYMPNTANTDEYFYYVEANANNGKTQVRPITAPDGYWNFQVEMTTSVDQITRSTTRLEPIFPNPASAITCIPVTTQYSKQATIELVDIWGRTVETIFSGQLPRGDSKHFIHADQYASGTYFVRLRTEQQTEVQKLIIGY
jgi:agmatine deiminase